MNLLAACRRPLHPVALLAGVAALAAACGGGIAGEPGAGDAERGRQLLGHYQCGACHIVPGVEAAQGTLAVTLESFGRRSYIAGRVPNRPELLQRWLIEPASLVPGTAMPAMGVSRADARDMAAYLGALR